MIATKGRLSCEIVNKEKCLIAVSGSSFDVNLRSK
jgi:hypothetical protein